ncbi:AMP-binding protein [Variovorax sp. J22P168]|uniref:AMP-binding protein n=1 Tax=Variovorax jilinensis TaxID=3053513 RepID=UPI0025780F33|nr:AMP-binding protein [Variovorax sp. J22P168]MDM0015802.1 AMP-binding protein [Variovorax sp. J22P168]
MIIDSFDAGAAAFPDRVFVQGGDLRLDYRAAADASHAVAAALVRDVRPGTHVGVLSPNHAMVLPAMLGVMRSGAVFVPLNARDPIDDIVWFASFCEIRVLICHAQYAPHLERMKAGIPTLERVIGLTEVLEPAGDSIVQWVRDFAGQRVNERRADDDIAIIKSSGGTTGRPKAIMQSHRSLETAYRISNQFMPPRKDPVHLVVAPLTHAAGATMVALARIGARNVIAPSADPAVILEAIERERVTHIFLPPTMIYRLLAHPDVATRDCTSLEYVMYGAAPMSVDKLREGLARWGQVFVQFYGQSEVPGVITCLSRKDHFVHGDANLDRHLASAGRPSGACEVALMDDEGNIVGIGERGEIVARGDLVSPGYYNNPEATAEARAFGWHHTGDIGVFDENGFLSVVDRKKDMVISGGFNIYPSEIEQVIWGHPAVQDCVVVGVPDADWGERLTAVVELKEGTRATAEEIIDMCRQRFGSLKTPKQVEFWGSLPRSPVGKVLKKDVRSQLAAAAGQA